MDEEGYALVDLVTTNLIADYPTLEEARAAQIEIDDPDIKIMHWDKDGRYTRIDE